MKKIKIVVALILLTMLFGGCGDINRQNQSQKVSEELMSTESEEEFSTNSKLENKNVDIDSVQYTYSELEDGTVWIKKISFLERKGIKVLRIPSKINERDVTVLGHSYGTGIYDMISDDKDYDGCDENIFGVMLEESFGKKQPKKIYDNTENIEQIILPATVKVLGLDTFEYLPRYQVLDIGDCVAKNMEYILVNYGWSAIKISKTNSLYKLIENMVMTKDGKELVKVFGKCDTLRVPDGVEKIKENAFLSIKADELFIPSSVNEIQVSRHNVHNNIMYNYIKDVNVSKDNKVYGKLENSIYKKSNMELILLCNKKQKIVIPEGIKIVKDFYYNGYSEGAFKLIRINRFEFPQSMIQYDCAIDCDGKATVLFKSKRCPKLGHPLFMGESSLTIYVPNVSKKEYKKKLKDEIGDADKIIGQE